MAMVKMVNGSQVCCNVLPMLPFPTVEILRVQRGGLPHLAPLRLCLLRLV